MISRVTYFNHLANMLTTTIRLSFLPPDKSYSTSLQVYSSKAAYHVSAHRRSEVQLATEGMETVQRHIRNMQCAEHKVLTMCSSSWSGVFGIRGVCKDERGDNWRWFIWNTMSLAVSVWVWVPPVVCGMMFRRNQHQLEIRSSHCHGNMLSSLLVMGEWWCHNMVPRLCCICMENMII